MNTFLGIVALLVVAYTAAALTAAVLTLFTVIMADLSGNKKLDRILEEDEREHLDHE